MRGRPNLARLCLLVDCRHGLKDSDRDWLKLADIAAVSCQVVLTKADELGAMVLAERCGETAAELRSHPAARPAVIATSARTGQGVAELRAILAAVARPAPIG